MYINSHRSGTLLEDMYWFDYETESIICHKLDEVKEQTIRSTHNIDRKLKTYPSVIPVHTHPSSLPPSPADFNCMVNYGYDLGIVLCHNGKVILYTANHCIDDTLWERYVQNFLLDGCDEFSAQIQALNKFKDNGDIDFWEV